MEVEPIYFYIVGISFILIGWLIIISIDTA